MVQTSTVEKTSPGRPKGSPNKRTTRVARMIEDQFAERGTSLMKEMVELAMAASTEPRVRAQLLLGMARFVYPQLQAITVKHDDAPQTAFILDLGGGETLEVKSGSIGHENGHKLIEQP